MKVVLTAVNARYYHTNLAVRILRNVLINKGCNTELFETSINDSIERAMSCLYRKNADIYCFSVYIWNAEYIKKLCSGLKKLKPESRIILGGPEVSYNTERLLSEMPYADYIICGEGEITLPSLIDALENGKSCEIPGVAAKGYTNPSAAMPVSFDDIPFPFLDGEVKSLKDRILYYESSRGCPYSCAYCLSGANGKVRFMHVERLKTELTQMCSEGAGLIKFVDRTFNADKKRAREIFRFLSGLQCDTQFHFEICASLLEEEDFELLKAVPEGRFRFEIGIQSVNKASLKAIERNEDTEKALAAAKRLMEYKNIHLHLDLIAGLPYEDYKSFGRSFDMVYKCADVLQLGFLKLLYGSKLREEADKLGYVYSDYPPYEVFCSNAMSFADITRLKDIEEVLECYKNSGAFDNSLAFILEYFASPFDFFEKLTDYINNQGKILANISRKDRYSQFYNFILISKKEKAEEFAEYLKLDFIKNNRGEPPFACSRNPDGFAGICHSFFADDNMIKRYIPEYAGETPKNINKSCDIHVFTFGYKKVLLFDRRHGKILDITEGVSI